MSTQGYDHEAHHSTRSRRELHIMVVCEWDTNRRYRVILRGNLNKLDVRKLKVYIDAKAGVPPEHQELVFADRILREDDVVGKLGLYEGAQVLLRSDLYTQAAPTPLPTPPPSASSPPRKPAQHYYSPSESDVATNHVSTRHSRHSSDAPRPWAREERLTHYPLPYADAGDIQGIRPDHVGRMRQMHAEAEQLLAAVPPNPSYVNEYHAGRNDYAARQERLAVEAEYEMQLQLDALRDRVGGAQLPASYDGRQMRMIGPSRDELVQKMRAAERQRDEALAAGAQKDITLAEQATAMVTQAHEMAGLNATMNRQRHVINAQRTFVLGSGSPLRAVPVPVTVPVPVPVPGPVQSSGESPVRRR